jgi:hypothetical protein
MECRQGITEEFRQRIAKSMVDVHTGDHGSVKKLEMEFRFAHSDLEQLYIIGLVEDSLVGFGRYIPSRDLFSLKKYRLEPDIEKNFEKLARVYDFRAYMDKDRDTSNNGKFGYLYILENESLPNLIKIGFTKKSAFQRAAQLSNTSIPTPYKVAYLARVAKPREVEKEVHHLLADVRVNDKREFFNLDAASAIEVIRARFTYIDLRGLGHKP